MSALRIPPSAPLAAARGVLSTTFDGEVVLLNETDGVYYGLQDVGARVWQLIERAHSLDVIRDIVSAEYDVDADACANDLHELVADLIDRGLVVTSA